MEYCNISTDGDVAVTLGSLILVTTSSSSSFDANEYDARVKADWTMTFAPGIQPGYRIQKIKINVDDKAIDGDIDFSGLYIGAFLRF